MEEFEMKAMLMLDISIKSDGHLNLFGETSFEHNLFGTWKKRIAAVNKGIVVNIINYESESSVTRIRANRVSFENSYSFGGKEFTLRMVVHRPLESTEHGHCTASVRVNGHWFFCNDQEIKEKDWYDDSQPAS
jgi:hypothetical protein